MVEDTLRELGLNDKEIKIYLSLLPLGSAPASILGKRTKITRSTAQYSCQQLVKKGLISVIEKNNSFIYTPESPDKIIYLLEQQKKEIENKEAQVNRIIGNLKNMMSTSAVLPKVQFFEGKQGIIDAFGKLKKDISENHKVSNEILNYVDPVSEDFDQKIIDTVYDLVNYRIKHKVKARLITADGKIPKLLQKKDTRELRVTKIAKDIEFGRGEHFIYCDKIYQFTMDKNLFFAYVVKDKFAAQLNRALFEIAWRNL